MCEKSQLVLGGMAKGHEHCYARVYEVGHSLLSLLYTLNIHVHTGILEAVLSHQVPES
jgi:hypothetical protein